MGCDAFWGQKWIAYLSKVVRKAFREYIDVFMKIFLDDYIIFSDLSNHIEKLIKCFLKCKKLSFIQSKEMCIHSLFLNYLGTFSKENNTHVPKKIKAIIEMIASKTPHEIQMFNEMFLHLFEIPIINYLEKLRYLIGQLHVKPIGKTSENNIFKLPFKSIPIKNKNFIFILIHLN
jgi:hypothetical protein